MINLYTEIKVNNAHEFARAIRNVINWSMLDENWIALYQPNGVDEEVNTDNFLSYTFNSQMVKLEFDAWIDTIMLDPYKPLVMMACNTSFETVVIKPTKVKMTKMEMVKNLSFSHDIDNLQKFCDLRTKEQVINVLIGDIMNKIIEG